MPAERAGAGILPHKVAIEQEKCPSYIQDHKALHVYDLSGSGRGGKGREGREGSTGSQKHNSQLFWGGYALIARKLSKCIRKLTAVENPPPPQIIPPVEDTSL